MVALFYFHDLQEYGKKMNLPKIANTCLKKGLKILAFVSWLTLFGMEFFEILSNSTVVEYYQKN